MTFRDLRTLVRREIIVDEYADAFEDGDINDALWRASYEIAAAFDFPRATESDDVAAGAVEVEAPADCLRVHSLNIGGDDGKSVDVQRVLAMRSGARRPLRYFNFDPRRNGNILIAPPSLGGASILEYTRILTRPDAADFDDAEPWDGILSPYHPMIVYRAGVALYQAEEREDEVAHWDKEYQLRAQELAAFLGRTDVGSLMIEPAMRDDKGAEG